MKELHDERLDIPVLSVCSVVCDVQMIVVIRKESMVTALDPMRLDFILTIAFTITLLQVSERCFGNVEASLTVPRISNNCLDDLQGVTSLSLKRRREASAPLRRSSAAFIHNLQFHNITASRLRASRASWR
jgi:hypothetical protein